MLPLQFIARKSRKEEPSTKDHSVELIPGKPILYLSSPKVAKQRDSDEQHFDFFDTNAAINPDDDADADAVNSSRLRD